MGRPTRPVGTPSKRTKRDGVLHYYATRSDGHYVDIVEEAERFVVLYSHPTFHDLGCTLQEVLFIMFEDLAENSGTSVRDYCEEVAIVAAQQYAKLL